MQSLINLLEQHYILNIEQCSNPKQYKKTVKIKLIFYEKCSTFDRPNNTYLSNFHIKLFLNADPNIILMKLWLTKRAIEKAQAFYKFISYQKAKSCRAFESNTNSVDKDDHTVLQSNHNRNELNATVSQSWKPTWMVDQKL